jgi:hypothetical protein
MREPVNGRLFCACHHFSHGGYYSGCAGSAKGEMSGEENLVAGCFRKRQFPADHVADDFRIFR